MRIRNSVFAAFAALGALLVSNSPNVASATVVQWQIVSSASSIQLNLPTSQVNFTLTSTAAIAAPLIGTSVGGNVRVVNPLPLGATFTSGGWTTGRTQNVQGTFLTKLNDGESDPFDATSIQFLGGNTIDGIDSGSYSPNADATATGSGQSAPSDFGLRLRVALSILTSNIDVAIRNALYTLENDVPIAVAGGAFDSELMDVGFAEGSAFIRARSGTVGDLVNGALADLDPPFQLAVAGDDFIAQNAAAGGVITAVGLQRFITIPINVPFNIELEGVVSLSGSTVGQIVAMHWVPEPSSYAMMAMGAAMLLPMARRWRRKSA